jgi:hypothetical protein
MINLHVWVWGEYYVYTRNFWILLWMGVNDRNPQSFFAFLVDRSWADPQKTSRVGTLPKVKMEMDSDIEMPWF